MFRYVFASMILFVGSPVFAQDDPKSLARQARLIFKHHCFDCHSGENSTSNWPFDVTRQASMLEKHDDYPPVIVPGKSPQSKLWKAIESDRMPQGKDKLNTAEKTIIKKWIDAGAPPFPGREKATFVSLPQMLTAVRNDLRDQDPKDRPYRRYFTLTHLSNNADVDDEDLRIYRAALIKALNSLNWNAKLLLPGEKKDLIPLAGTEDSVYAIDVRSLHWGTQLWDELLKFYPYGIRLDGHPTDRALRRIDEEIFDLTKLDGVGCNVPIIRADWFVATATRPPIYHVLMYDEYLPVLKHRHADPKNLANPKNMKARDIEDYLGIDIAARFESPTPDQIARAGFGKSGVSGQNRLLERLASKHGAYWKSYDFKADSARIKLTRFPLGPLNLFPDGKHPYETQAFIHDGGEILFHLPNGLLAYLLIDGNDGRIDEGPISVVGDGTRTSGTPAIVTGVSCMNCHTQGMINFKDTIRKGHVLFGKAQEKVEDLFPEQKKWDDLLAEDIEKFVRPVEKCMSPFLLVGDDQKKNIRDFREPIGEIARHYRLEYLTINDIAAELFEQDPAKVKMILGGQPMKLLGLNVLNEPNGVIGRLEWESRFRLLKGRGEGPSLYQQVATQLGGRPVNVAK